MLTKIEMQYMDAVIQMNRRQRDNEVDWEQRRYEIAKEVYPHAIVFHRNLFNGQPKVDIGKVSAQCAVAFADDLIAALKNNPQEQQ